MARSTRYNVPCRQYIIQLDLSQHSTVFRNGNTSLLNSDLRIWETALPMERPRVWSKQLTLPCALEHAVLRVRVFRRAETWTPSFIQKATVSSGNCQPGSEIENDIVLPPEDPLLVALDRFRRQHDVLGASTGALRCWAKLVGKVELFRSEDDNDQVDAETGVNDDTQTRSETRDSLAVYEISDGILTESRSLLSGIDLRGASCRDLFRRLN